MKKLKNKSSKLEGQIADLEKDIEKIDLELAQNYDVVSSKPDFFENYKAKKAKLETLMLSWEEVEDVIGNYN